MSRPTNLLVFIYLRKSRKDIEEEKKAQQSGESFDTLDRHRRALLAVAAKEGHTIVNIYEEVVSGESVTERPQIQEMLRQVDAGRADGVLVMDLDRLGRGDMLDQGLLDRAFRYSGTQLLTPTEVYDPSSETWELVFGIKSLVAREELKAITRRMQRGRKASASEGKSVGKKPPFGYKRDENLRLYPDDATAWAVRKMFEMMRDGHGRQAIAQELDRLGVAPPDEKRKSWSPSSVTAIIKNEVYIGNIIWGQVQYFKRNGKYERKRMPREQWTLKEGAHEPLVTAELFEAANRAHTGRWRPSTTAAKKLSNPLAGVLKCEVCGYTMLFTPRKDRPNSPVRCPKPQCKGVQKGALLPLVEKKVHKSLEILLRSMEGQITRKQGEDSADEKTFLIGSLESKRKEISELETQKSNLHDLLEKGVYDVDTFVQRQQNLTQRISAIQGEVNELDTKLIALAARKNNTDVYIPNLRRVVDLYFEVDVEARNKLLKQVIEKATFLRKPDWTAPDQFEIKIYPKISR